MTSSENATPLPPDAEIVFRTSRSGGPGGQNVNKVETRVEALWNLDTSDALTDTQRERLRAALGRRVHDGTVRVVSGTERTQRGNRQAAVERLRALVAKALVPRKRRKRTAVPRGAKEARLEAKRRRGVVKRGRSGQGAE